MPHRSTTLLATLLLSVMFSGCRSHATFVEVLLGTDAPADRRLSVSVSVQQPSDIRDASVVQLVQFGGAMDPQSASFTGSFSVIPPMSGPRSLAVVLQIQASVEGTADAPSQQFRVRRRFSLSANQGTTVRVFLPMACLNLSADCRNNGLEPCTVALACEERNQTCGDNGECVGLDVTPEPRPDGSTLFTRPDGSVSRFDTGVARDGSVTDVSLSDVRSDATPPIGNIRGISAGIGNTCVFSDTGAHRCWGDALFGRTGLGNTMNTSVPTPTILPSPVVAMPRSWNHSCALIGDIAVGAAAYCWGHNDVGQVGVVAADPVLVPVPPPFDRFRSIAVGYEFSCAISTLERVWCWGANESQQLGTASMLPRGAAYVLTLPGSARQLCAGLAHACTVLLDGSVRCWGRGDFGQLGNGANPMSSGVVQPMLPQAATSITCGTYFTCATTTSNNLYCWGQGGMLGNGLSTASNVPVEVVALRGIAQRVTAGLDTTCSLTTVNDVRCWGANVNAAVGNGRTSALPILTPAPRVNLPRPALAIAVGDGHSCAVLANSEVWCWGRNESGELGRGTVTNTESIPGPVMF